MKPSVPFILKNLLLICSQLPPSCLWIALLMCKMTDCTKQSIFRWVAGLGNKSRTKTTFSSLFHLHTYIALFTNIVINYLNLENRYIIIIIQSVFIKKLRGAQSFLISSHLFLNVEHSLSLEYKTFKCKNFIHM